MKRKRIVPVLFLVAVAVIAYALLRRPSELAITGIVATDTVLVSAEIQGRLQELLVKEGDTVKAGQLLGTIQPAEWQADLSFAENNEKQARAALTQADANLKYQEVLTENQIRQAEANAAAAQAQVAAAEADFEKARLAYGRAEELHKTGAESVEFYDEARTTFNNAQARLDLARKQAAASDAAVNLAKASESEILARRAAQQANADALAAQTAQKEKAQVRLDYTKITAPIDGVVDVRAARAGEIVAPGQAIVTLINPDDLWVRIDVEESYVDLIRLGDHLNVKLPSGATLDGTVFYRRVDADYATQRDVSRTKRDIKTFEVRLRCDNRDRRLAVGLTTYVTLPLTHRQ